MKRADHPLTPLLVDEDGRVLKITVNLRPRHGGALGLRRPYWRARDGVWAVRDGGCHQYLKATGRPYPTVEVWSHEDHAALAAARSARAQAA